jgi:predicted amidohydrolase
MKRSVILSLFVCNCILINAQVPGSSFVTNKAIQIHTTENKLTIAQTIGPSTSVKVAGYQMNVSKDIQTNKNKILTAMRNAANEGADFLATPEGSLSGYTSDFDQEQVQIALSEIESRAKDLNIGLLLGTCYKEIVGKIEYCYNQVRVYAPDGKFMGTYNKILRCSSLDFPGTGEMHDYVEGDLKTFTWNGQQFGILICNDLWATPGYTTMPNPYLPWKLKKLGVQFIVHCINSGTNQKYKPFHESSAELWALSLKIPILEINASFDNRPVNARSGFINSNGERILTVPDLGEHLFVTELAGEQ